VPRRVKAPAVTAFWDDSRFWPGGDLPYDFALRGTYTRHQRQRPMTNEECMAVYGVGAMTGQPWIGKERSFVHGRETVLVHMNSLPILNKQPSLNPFLGVVTFPPGVVTCPSV